MGDETSIDGYTVDRRGDMVTVEIWYPGSDGQRVRFVEVGLLDVRAADSVRISYDFDRDGWKIEQARFFDGAPIGEVYDPGWAEVAFVRAWALREREE